MAKFDNKSRRAVVGTLNAELSARAIKWNQQLAVYGWGGGVRGDKAVWPLFVQEAARGETPDHVQNVVELAQGCDAIVC